MKRSTFTFAIAGGAIVLLSVVLLLKNPAGSDESEAGQAEGWNGTGKLEFREAGGRNGRRNGPRFDDPEVQRMAEEWYRELLARHPEFQVEFKDVPDRENGFLKFLDLADFLSPGEPHAAQLPTSDEMLEMLAGKTEFDAALVNGWIASNPELYERLLDFAEAPDQSVQGQSMERYHFIAARLPHQTGQLLVASARAAMERGDPEEALRLYRASVHLADHFDGVEIPSLLGKTVSVLVRLNALSSFQEHILPQVIDDPESLATWRRSLPRVESVNDTAPPLFTGEWNITTRMYLLPAMISRDPKWLGDAPVIDRAAQQAVAEAYASRMARFIDHAASAPMSELLGEKGTVPLLPESSLSPDARKYLEIIEVGTSAWLSGLGRGVSVTAQHHALLAIALGEEPPAEPVTGQPFLWDPASRTLSPPPGAPEDVAPLRLPSAP